MSEACRRWRHRVVVLGGIAFLGFVLGEQLARAEEFTFAGISAQVLGEPAAGCSFEVRPRSISAKIDHFTLAGPPRLVVDLQGEPIPRNRTFEAVDTRCVTGIRFGVQPHGARVVFDLRAPAPQRYEASTVSGRFVVRFVESASTGERAAPPPDSSDRMEGDTTAQATPLPSPTWTPTVVPTSTPIPSSTPTSTPSATETARPSPTATFTSTPVPTMTPTVKPSATPAPTATATPSPTPEPTMTPAAPVTSEPTPVPPASVDTGEQGEDAEVSPAVTSSPSVTEQAVLKFKVDRVVVEFKPEDRPVQNIVVTNTSEETLRMTAKVRAVESPGLAEEREVETKAILVSPLFFTLEPGASRQVRLVGVEEPDDVEQVFRVTLSPGRGESDPQARLTVNGKVAELNVITAFAVTVLRAPESAVAKLTTSREGPDIVVRNDGERSVALTEIKVCRSASVSSCHQYPARRLYPGNVWRVSVPVEGRLELLKRVGRDFETTVIEGASR